MSDFIALNITLVRVFGRYVSSLVRLPLLRGRDRLVGIVGIAAAGTVVKTLTSLAIFHL